MVLPGLMRLARLAAMAGQRQALDVVVAVELVEHHLQTVAQDLKHLAGLVVLVRPERLVVLEQHLARLQQQGLMVLAAGVVWQLIMQVELMDQPIQYQHGLAAAMALALVAAVVLALVAKALVVQEVTTVAVVLRATRLALVGKGSW